MAQKRTTRAEPCNRTELAAALRREIGAGNYAIGSKLPSYRDLATRFRAAPNTVGEAIRMLAAEGVVLIKPNVGAFVAEPEQQPRSVSDQLRDTRAGLVGVRDQVRATQRTLSELEIKVTTLLGDLPTE